MIGEVLFGDVKTSHCCNLFHEAVCFVDIHWLNGVPDVRLGLGESDVANILCVILLLTFLSPACLVFCRSFNPLNILSGTSTRAVDKFQVFYPQLMMFLASPSAKLLTDQSG